MKTRAVRLYGAHDLRLEEFELSPVGDDGVRCKVISDSLCMSSFKALEQGAAQARAGRRRDEPDDHRARILRRHRRGRQKLGAQIQERRRVRDPARALLQGPQRAWLFVQRVRRRRDVCQHPLGNAAHGLPAAVQQRCLFLWFKKPSP